MAATAISGKFHINVAALITVHTAFRIIVAPVLPNSTRSATALEEPLVALDLESFLQIGWLILGEVVAGLAKT